MSFTICLAPAQTIEYSQGGGHLWVYLNWALALRAAGSRVIWLEGVDLSERANARRQRHGTNVHHSARFHAVNPCVAADGLGVVQVKDEVSVGDFAVSAFFETISAGRRQLSQLPDLTLILPKVFNDECLYLRDLQQPLSRGFRVV